VLSRASRCSWTGSAGARRRKKPLTWPSGYNGNVAGRTALGRDWLTWWCRFAFDVIGELFFSRKFGFMENAHDHEGYIHALDLLVPFFAVVCAMPAYVRPLFLASGATVPGVFKALGALQHIETASDACLAQRRQEDTRDEAGRRGQGQKDMLDGFFDIVRSKGGAKDFTLTEVKTEVYSAL